MRTFISIILVVGGIGLCLLGSLASSFVAAPSAKPYHQQLAAASIQQTYTREEYTTAAWQAWTNRVRLPAQEAYTVSELKNGMFGLGTKQTSCDRRTFEALIADASGYRRRDRRTARMSFGGFLAILVGAFLLGGTVSPKKKII
jgi:hypothetical protein